MTKLNMIDVSQFDHVEWIKNQVDADLWHKAFLAAIAYIGDPHGITRWVLAQTETDRSTPAWLFTWAEGELYLQGNTDFMCDYMTDAEMSGLLDMVLDRCKGQGFKRNALGINPEFAKANLNCLETLAQLVSQNKIRADRAPIELFAKPFPALTPSQWVLDGDGLIYPTEYR